MPLKKPEPDDDLLRFARRHGVSTEDVLSHPDNADLFKRRASHALHADDELALPDQAHATRLLLQSGQTHVLVYAPPERILQLQLKNGEGRPVSVDYTLSDFLHDDSADGTAPEELYGYAHEGEIFMELPASVVSAKLTVDDHPEWNRTLQLGRMDPASRHTGVLSRLTMLGFYSGPLDIGSHDPRWTHAVKAFQRRQGLRATGQADETTRSALVAACKA